MSRFLRVKWSNATNYIAFAAICDITYDPLDSGLLIRWKRGSDIMELRVGAPSMIADIYRQMDRYNRQSSTRRLDIDRSRCTPSYIRRRMREIGGQ